MTEERTEGELVVLLTPPTLELLAAMALENRDEEALELFGGEDEAEHDERTRRLAALGLCSKRGGTWTRSGMRAMEKLYDRVSSGVSTWPPVGLDLGSAG